MGDPREGGGWKWYKSQSLLYTTSHPTPLHAHTDTRTVLYLPVRKATKKDKKNVAERFI